MTEREKLDALAKLTLDRLVARAAARTIRDTDLHHAMQGCVDALRRLLVVGPGNSARLSDYCIARKEAQDALERLDRLE